MPMDRSRYPPDWEKISLRIRGTRAGWQCEWIGGNGERCQAKHWDWHPITGSRVVLSTAHLGVDLPDGSPGDKHNKMDCRDENLMALCQLHHLALDRADHILTQAINRRRKQHDAGQLELEM